MVPLLHLVSLLVGCSSEPARIALDAPPAMLTSVAPIALKGRVVDAGGKSIEEVRVSYALSPRDIADVTEDGVLVCGKAGKVQVTLSAGELVRSVEVFCALVSKIEGPEQIGLIVGETPVKAGAKALDAAGQEIQGLSVAMASADAAILEVNAEGFVGLRAGHTSVRMSAGTVSLDVPVDVVEIGSIEIEESLLLTLGENGRRVTATIRTLDGKILEDFELRGDIADPNVASFEDGLLTPRHFGATTLNLAAGKASRTVQVGVAEKLAPVPVILADGKSQAVPFSPGIYLVVGEFAADGSGYGVEAPWIGANCAGSKETQKLLLMCETATPATLVLQNPTSWGMGPAATGSIVVVRSPIPLPKR